MESGGGEGEEEEAFSVPMPDWDPIAEAEVRAIEAAYATTKRRGSHLDLNASDHRSKGRRLPNWAKAASSSRISTLDGGARDDGLSYPRNELWTIAPPPCRVNLKVTYPAMTFGGCIVYSRTAPEVEQATVEILEKINLTKQNMDQISVGFDIEWRPTFKRGEAARKAAVMQICMDTAHCYVMHIIHSGIPPILKSLLEDCSSVKVGICVENDARKISRDYDVSVEHLEDLSRYANLKLGGAHKKWSLCSLTEMLTCKQLEKPNKIRMGNWEAEVLSSEQLKYAATDAFASWYLYQVLKSFPDGKSENGTVGVNDVVS